MIHAIIMASGLSKRMGCNKLLLPFRGKPLIKHTLDLLDSLPMFHPILVSHDPIILEMGNQLGIETVYNPHPEIGQSESIRLGIDQTPIEAGFAFFTGDCPLMDEETLIKLHQTFIHEQTKMIVPTFGDKKGTPVFFPYQYKDELRNITGDQGGKQVIYRHLDQVMFVAVHNLEVLFDVDTMEDYQEIRDKE